MRVQDLDDDAARGGACSAKYTSAMPPPPGDG
jgi:hypothetical protein